MFKARYALFALSSGFFLFLLDRVFKKMALGAWNEPKLFGAGWFGWEPFLNKGAAFGLPLPVLVIIVLTIPIVAVLGYLAVQAARENNWQVLLGAIFVLAGAASNLFDRIVYQETVDYWRVLTGVINLADVIIIAGGLILVFGAVLTRKQELKKEAGAPDLPKL